MDKKLDPLFGHATSNGSLPGTGAIVLDKTGQMLYKHVSGSTNLSDPSATLLKSNTQILFWSCSKLVTAVAALQLLEQGKISLDDPVEKHFPPMSERQLLHGWRDGPEEDGSPILKPPKRKTTILHLMTHTSGICYDFNNADLMRYFKWADMPPALQLPLGQRRLYQDVPLMYEPGTRYEYGMNSDWLGFVVEAVSGMSLQDYTKKHIFDPLGMKNSVAYIDEETRSEGGVLAVHVRDPNTGQLTGVPQILPPPNSECFGGGSWLISTLDDYSQFLVTLLNNGTHPVSEVQILKPETVERFVFADAFSEFPEFGAQVSHKSAIGAFEPSLAPNIFTRHQALLPGVAKGWSCGSLMINESDVELTLSDGQKRTRGRNKQSGAWFGIGNLYYWMDPKAGVTGLLGTSVLPSLDKTVTDLFDEMEAATYEYISHQNQA